MIEGKNKTVVTVEETFDPNPYLTLLEIYSLLLHHFPAPLPTLCNLQNCTLARALSS